MRPVQEVSLEPILRGDSCVIVAPTSGGKTEAAVLPLLSRILDERSPPTSVLYVAPMKALLNDLAQRLELLLEPLSLTSAVWHGDVTNAGRRRIAAAPPDVLLATPESVEVLLSFASLERRSLISGIETVVVDEAHAFFGDDRGTHLLALIERLAQYAQRDVQRIALSATVGNPADVAAWLCGSSARPMRVCTVPKDQGRVERFEVRHLPVPVDLLDYLTGLRSEKAIVFVPSRRDVETLSRALLDRRQIVWPHHSAISANDRRATEASIREASRGLLIATSTFELGIDIGNLDRVVQIDAPATVSAMVQRLGRTGRRAGTQAVMSFVTRKTETLLTVLALLRLHAGGWIEPLEPPVKPYLVLIQQIFANLIQTGGVPRATLVRMLADNAAFRKFSAGEIARVVDALADAGSLQIIDERLALSAQVERRFSFRNFGELASVFSSDASVDVVDRDCIVGSIQRWYLERIEGQADRSFLLGGKAWRIRRWDRRAGVVEVEPADRARAPVYLGGGIGLSGEIAASIRTILGRPEGVSLPAECKLEDAAQLTWKHAAEHASSLELWRDGCVLSRLAGTTRLHTFAGSRVNRTIAIALTELGIDVTGTTSVALAFGTGLGDVETMTLLRSFDTHRLEQILKQAATDELGLRTKFLTLLPVELRAEITITMLTDITGAAATLARGVRWCESDAERVP